MAVWIWKDRLPHVQRFCVNCHLCHLTIIHKAVNFYFFRSPKHIDREASFERRVSPIQSAV